MSASVAAAGVLGCSAMDVLASNHLACALYTDFDVLAVWHRNMMRLVFLDDGFRSLCTDWEGAARSLVGLLRLYAGTRPQDPGLAEPVVELTGPR